MAVAVVTVAGVAVIDCDKAEGGGGGEGVGRFLKELFIAFFNSLWNTFFNRSVA